MKKAQGKIGIFDSGFGGLTILKKVVELMPSREYLYLGDNLHAPYGDRTQAEIFKYTVAGVEWLFSNGAEIVVLACNTASANALRKIQKDFLPFKYAQKKVLGIIIPTAEDMIAFSASGHIGVLSTKATALTQVFEKEVKKRNAKIKIKTGSGGDLVRLIEKFDDNEQALEEEIKKVVKRLIVQDKLMDTLILGCTHYALISDKIKKILPKKINVIGQGKIVSEKLMNYLERHSEISKKLSKQSSVCFWTTSNSEETKKKMMQFWKETIFVSVANYEIN